MTDPIRVLLVDDQRLMREGLRTLLELEPDILVVGEAENGAVAVDAYADLKPDVVLMDIRMPQMDGVEATRHLCRQWAEARVLVLTTFDDDAYVFEGIRAGALGYLLKDMSGQELAAAVRTVATGHALIDSAVARKVLGQFSRLASPGTLSAAGDKAALPEPLSEREQEILQFMAQGWSNPEIARQLHLAEGTIKNYVTVILQKTGTRDRTQAVLRAKSLGLV